ncbi:MAG: hypothetical protein AB7I48_25955, partial [Planctomycetaceae bacterium]
MPLVVRKGVRVHDSIRDQIESRKRRSARRLDQFNCPDDLSRPMLRGGAIKYELAGRAVGTAGGGIGLMPRLVRELQLAEAIDAARRKVWARQPPEFFAEARIDAGGKTVATDAACKDGIDSACNGVWGDHPLVVSLANTKEVLRLQNRPGNRPSHEGAAALLDECSGLCRDAGFRQIVLRGGTDFSPTARLDRWHDQPLARAAPGAAGAAADVRVPHVRQSPDACALSGADDGPATRAAAAGVGRLATDVLPTGGCARPRTARTSPAALL